MRSKIFGCTMIALCAGLLLAGCDKMKPKTDANTKSAAERQAEQQAQAIVQGQSPEQKQTHYGRSMEQGNVADCVSHLNQAGTFLYMCGDYLPTSKAEFTQNGCSADILRCSGGADYEYLVKSKVRNNSGNVKVLRCPVHNKVLYSDGHVE